MELEDLQKLMAELMAAHRETEHHVVRMMERQSDLEAMTQELRAANEQQRLANEQQRLANDQQRFINEQQRLTDERLMTKDGELERLIKQVTENNRRLNLILEVHDFDIDELNARLKRLEERRRNGQ